MPRTQPTLSCYLFCLVTALVSWTQLIIEISLGDSTQTIAARMESSGGLPDTDVKSTTFGVPKTTKSTLHVTAKKLPWLENRASQPPSPVSPRRPKSGTETPSPRSHSQARRASVALPPPRLTKISSTAKESVQATLIPQYISSASGSSPSPAERHHLSQARRVSRVSQNSPSHRAQKRLSIIQNGYGRNTDPRADIRLRADSLAPVPDHLEVSSTSESTLDQKVLHAQGTTLHTMTPQIQTSMEKPAPGHSTLKRIGNRKLSNAVQNIEIMAHEAVDMASATTDQKQVQEIYDIIDGARKVIQEVVRNPEKNLMATAPPLNASDSSDPASIDGYKDHNHMITTEEEEEEEEEKTATSIPDLPQNDVNRRLHAGSAPNLTSIDWAYRCDDKKTSHSSPFSSVDHAVEGDPRLCTKSDLLLPPDPVQAAPRGHVDFVLRPVTNDDDRGRSDYRMRHRHHRSHHPGSGSRSRSQHRRRHRRRRRRLDKSSDLMDSDGSSDESESIPQPFGNQVGTGEQDHHHHHHHHTLTLRRHHQRQPIARNWTTSKKRLTATVACINTALLGIIIGIYAGEVPRIQYFLADERHVVIVGNVVLYLGLAISTFISWTLPLLHGRRPYLLASLAIALPLQFPQAIVVGTARSPNTARYRSTLLCARALSGLVLGFANVNHVTVLLDLFGASLQSKNPHQEFVVANDVRRHGGGMGMWLGIWSWCWIGSIAVGFQIGAAIIQTLTPDWGFYIVIVILVFALLLNILTPETRRAQYRKSVAEFYDRDENYITRRISRGEVKLHISTEGPMYWFEEVWAGMKLSMMMISQPGFLVLALYLGWIYMQITLVIVLLGALLSRDYRWRPRYVGAGVMSIAVGALLAIPLTKASIFSRERKTAFRTDSMTFQKQVTWSSHLVRRVIFTITLPLMALAYTVSSAGRPSPYMVPIVFAGAVGFLSVLAMAECYGLIMETFDTCDLQPGVNTRHRLQSMAVQDRRRRTNYTSFPRVSAGIFASQTLAFVGAAVATMVGGSMTRHLGAQASTGVTAGILLGLTLLLTIVLWRFKEVQVIPNYTFGTRRDTAAWQEFQDLEKMGRRSDWKAVIIGNPSGKMRRMSVLELGRLSRWTEIRKLNFLIKDPSILAEGKEKRRQR